MNAGRYSPTVIQVSGRGALGQVGVVALIGLVAAAFVLSLGLPEPWASVRALVPGLGRCGFHQLVGLPCPFCGLTRGVAAMASGDVVKAAWLNPTTPLLFVGLVGLGLTQTILALGRRRLVLSESPPLGWLAAGVGLMWALNLAFGHP